MDVLLVDDMENVEKRLRTFPAREGDAGQRPYVAGGDRTVPRA